MHKSKQISEATFLIFWFPSPQEVMIVAEMAVMREVSVDSAKNVAKFLHFVRLP